MLKSGLANNEPDLFGEKRHEKINAKEMKLKFLFFGSIGLSTPSVVLELIQKHGCWIISRQVESWVMKFQTIWEPVEGLRKPTYIKNMEKT